MPDQTFIRANPLTLREAVSKLDLSVIPHIDAVTFDKSPIDFGVVLAERLAHRRIDLTVNSATYVNLKIKGDDHFRASLFNLPPLPMTARPADFNEPILVNEHVPLLDLVSGPGDIRVDVNEFQFISDAGP